MTQAKKSKLTEVLSSGQKADDGNNDRYSNTDFLSLNCSSNASADVQGRHLLANKGTASALSKYRNIGTFELG